MVAGAAAVGKSVTHWGQPIDRPRAQEFCLSAAPPAGYSRPRVAAAARHVVVGTTSSTERPKRGPALPPASAGGDVDEWTDRFPIPVPGLPCVLRVEAPVR